MFTKLGSCNTVISSQISSHLSKYSQFERMEVMFFSNIICLSRNLSLQKLLYYLFIIYFQCFTLSSCNSILNSQISFP